MLAIREPLEEECTVIAPCSVISECSPRPQTPRYSNSELLTFGDDYDANIMQLIHTHLELDSHHSVAYIGPSREKLVPKIEKHFCLLTPITVLIAGGVTYKDISKNSRRLVIKLSQTGAEDFFTQASGHDAQHKRRFDRILINNSVQNLYDYETAFAHMRRCLNESGKLLILHRPSSITTLPYFRKAKEVLGNIEIPFMKIITSLQRTGCDVQWDLEHVPVTMAKVKWIALLRSRYPAELDIMSDKEIEDGIRELLDGPLNYLTPEIELEDRMILITGTPPKIQGTYPAVQRILAGPQLPYSELLDIEYTLDISEPMKKLL